jgi:hypothetical protein
MAGRDKPGHDVGNDEASKVQIDGAKATGVQAGRRRNAAPAPSVARRLGRPGDQPVRTALLVSIAAAYVLAGILAASPSSSRTVAPSLGDRMIAPAAGAR